jgi:hypothetical protein
MLKGLQKAYLLLAMLPLLSAPRATWAAQFLNSDRNREDRGVAQGQEERSLENREVAWEDDRDRENREFEREQDYLEQKHYDNYWDNRKAQQRQFDRDLQNHQALPPPQEPNNGNTTTQQDNHWEHPTDLTPLPTPDYKNCQWPLLGCRP